MGVNITMEKPSLHACSLPAEKFQRTPALVVSAVR